MIISDDAEMEMKVKKRTACSRTKRAGSVTSKEGNPRLFPMTLNSLKVIPLLERHLLPIK